MTFVHQYLSVLNGRWLSKLPPNLFVHDRQLYVASQFWMMIRLTFERMVHKQSTNLFRKYLSTTPVFSRRILSPLIKTIHPDMFGQDSDLIRKTNLSCLQALNEMCDSIEGLQRVGATFIEVTKPLKHQYKFDCFMRSQQQPIVKHDDCRSMSSDNSIGSGKTSLQTKSIKVLLNTPTILCARQRITQPMFEKSLSMLLYQLNPFFEHANLEGPFRIEEKKPRFNSATGEEEVFFLEDKTIVEINAFQKVIDLQTFEANICRRDRAIRRNAIETPKTRIDKKHHWEMMNDEVRFFSNMTERLIFPHKMMTNIDLVDD